MKALTAQKEIVRGAPSPELVDLWLARAFNAHDVEAAAAMYHPDASVVQLDQVHGSAAVAHGAAGIRETMAGYIGLKPHMDVVVHHTTVSGEFALCRSQWRITGTDNDGNRLKSITTEWRSCAACQAEGGSSSSTTPGEPTPRGQWTGLPRQPSRGPALAPLLFGGQYERIGTTARSALPLATSHNALL
jgi:ketosteroid isomerase-like protein